MSGGVGTFGAFHAPGFSSSFRRISTPFSSDGISALHARAGVVEDLDVRRDALVLDGPDSLAVVEAERRDLHRAAVDERAGCRRAR